MNARWVCSALALVAGLGTPACDILPISQVCTQRGCRDNFSLRIEQEDGPFPDWRLELDVDGQAITCPVPEPLESAFTASESCGDSVEISAITRSHCFEVEPNDMPCEYRDAYFVELTFYYAPRTVRVRVFDSEDNELGERTFTPEYEALYPNGEDCGPECLLADATWQL